MNYDCTINDVETREEISWVSSLYVISRTGPFTEISVCGRGSQMHAIIGPQTSGNFICIPEWQVGSSLASLDDVFWNRERLSPLIGPVDAVTLANGLKLLKMIESRKLPRRKN